MSRINVLKLKNFKRQTVVEQLTGKDIFVGSNGVGKSSRIQALQVAMLGYMPNGSGKQPQHTFELSTGDEMVVGVDTDAFGFGRTFTKKTKTSQDGEKEVSISQDITISPSQGESTIKDKEARIAAELGNFPVMLDFGSFLALSDNERRAFFYKLAGVDGDEWTKEKVDARLREKLLTEALEKNNPDAYSARHSMVAQALNEWRTGMDAEKSIQAMLEWAKSAQKMWNAEKRKSAGAVQKLAELKNQLEETDRNIAENRIELDRLHSEFTQVVAEISRQQEAQKEITRRLNRIEVLETEISNLENEPRQSEEAIEKVHAEIENLRSLIVDVDYTELYAENNRTIDENEKERHSIDDLSRDAHKKKDAAEARRDGLRKMIDQASVRGGICVISSKIECPKDFTPFVDWAKEQFDTSEKQLADAILEVKDLETKRTQLSGENRALSSERDKLHEKERQTMKENEHMRGNIAQMEQWVRDTESEEKDRQNKLTLYRSELSDIEAQPIEAIAGIDVLEKQRDGLSQSIESMKVKLQEQDKAKTTINNLKQSLLDASNSEHKHDAAKYIAEVMGPKGIQGDMLVGALSPIEAGITSNLNAMGIEHAFFFRATSNSGKEVFRFGWKNGDYEVDFNALSTGEQIIVLIAMMVALLDLANPSCKVLCIDNVENLDKKNFGGVISGLNALSDKLDNILIAGVIESDDIEGWTIHRLQ